MKIHYNNRKPQYKWGFFLFQRQIIISKAILFNLFRDYLSTAEQKEKIIKMQVEERRKNEQNKSEQYNLDIFVNKQKKPSIKEEHTELIEYKENIFKRILNKIRQFFHI